MSKNNTFKVPVKDLVVGLYVDLELGWADHPFTFSKFKIKDKKTIKIIQGLPLKQVTVFLDRSDVTILETSIDTEQDIDGTDTENEGEVDTTAWKEQKDVEEKTRLLHQKREQVSAQFKETAQQIQQMTSDLKKRPVNAIHNIDGIVTQMSAVFGGSANMMTQMVNLGSADHSDQNHLTNVTMLSLMIGKAEGMNTTDLTLLGAAALLHDVGLVNVPLAIRNKTSALSEAEQKIYQRHTFTGRQLIEKVRSMNVEILNTIEQHHEYLDGSGYPKGLKEEQLSKVVRIVTITNLYDNLCNPVDISASLTPKIALATLYKKYQGKLDKKLVERLIGILGVYPPGTVVRLTDGSLGLVISGDSDAPMNPSVLIYDPEIPKQDAKIICLNDFPDINIKEAINPGDFPPEIHQYLDLKQRLGYMVQSMEDFEEG